MTRYDVKASSTNNRQNAKHLNLKSAHGCKNLSQTIASFDTDLWLLGSDLCVTQHNCRVTDKSGSAEQNSLKISISPAGRLTHKSGSIDTNAWTTEGHLTHKPVLLQIQPIRWLQQHKSRLPNIVDAGVRSLSLRGFDLTFAQSGCCSNTGYLFRL